MKKLFVGILFLAVAVVTAIYYTEEHNRQQAFDAMGQAHELRQQLNQLEPRP